MGQRKEKSNNLTNYTALQKVTQYLGTTEHAQGTGSADMSGCGLQYSLKWFKLSIIEKMPFKQRLEGAEGVNQGAV